MAAISSVSPADGATGVPRNTELSVTFSDTSGILSTSSFEFTMRPYLASINESWDNPIAKGFPALPLTEGQTYTVSFYYTNSNILHEWSFTVEGGETGGGPSNVTVWDGTAEVPAVSVSKWDGAAEVPASAVEVV